MTTVMTMVTMNGMRTCEGRTAFFKINLIFATAIYLNIIHYPPDGCAPISGLKGV